MWLLQGKLREGIFSSRRNDAFALEGMCRARQYMTTDYIFISFTVYETSLYLTVIFDTPKQTTSVIPHLLPDLYLSSPPPHHNCTITILVSLLHHLVATYPSQLSFRQCLDEIPSSLMPRSLETLQWINSLSWSLRTRNYIKFEELTRLSAISQLFTVSGTDTDTLSTALASLSIVPDNNNSLPRRAFEVLVDNLRRKTRATTWNVIRAAYREFSCATAAEESGTPDWLARSLCLRRLLPYEVAIDADMWLEQQSLLGYVRRKEGTDRRWIVCKVG